MKKHKLLSGEVVELEDVLPHEVDFLPRGGAGVEGPDGREGPLILARCPDGPRTTHSRSTATSSASSRAERWRRGLLLASREGRLQLRECGDGRAVLPLIDDMDAVRCCAI